MKQINKSGRKLSVVLETTTKKGIHFCLAKEVNYPITRYVKSYGRSVVIAKSSLTKLEECYFVLWGPETDHSKNMESHGISELKSLKNRKMGIAASTKQFFKTIEASQNQNFIFGKNNKEVKI